MTPSNAIPATTTALVAAALALSFVGGPTASAQVDTRSKAPIDITAEQAEVSNARCVAIWRGSAEAIQEKTRIRADSLTVYSRSKAGGADDKPACGGVERIEADGHVFYVTPDQNARGDHAVYVQASDQIVMTGDVVVVQGQNVARGDKLTIKVSTREAVMESSATGSGKPGRVRAVFYPDKSAQADSPAKP
jgi:lipopolysaccharide export system protein LptA